MTNYIPVQGISNACKTLGHAMVVGGGSGALIASLFKVYWGEVSRGNTSENHIDSIKKVDSLKGILKEIQMLAPLGLKTSLGSSIVYLLSRSLGVIGQGEKIGALADTCSKGILIVNKYLFMASMGFFAGAYLYDVFANDEFGWYDQVNITAVHLGTMVYSAALGAAGVLTIDLGANYFLGK